MRITVIGIGMGSEGTLTRDARNALQRGELVIGAARIIGTLPPDCTPLRAEAVTPDGILSVIEQNGGMGEVCVVMSGDSGFYSGTAKLLPLLGGHEVTVLPGIATVQYMSARLGRPWQQVRLVSAHGVDCNIIGNLLAAGETFFLTGGTVTPRTIAEAVVASELPDVVLHIGENLSLPSERITTASPQQLAGRDFAPLSAVWAERKPSRRVHPYVTGGIPDELFVRGDVPMTKQEARTAAISKLGIAAADIVWDVGAGTGSVSVEIALADPMVRVYAVEQSPTACQLIEQNRCRFGAYNITAVQGIAPDTLQNLPVPNAVFVGGSKGRLGEILAAAQQCNPAVRVVVTAIALETLSEAMNALETLGFTQTEVTQLAVSRTKAAGGCHLLMANNPVFIISARGAV